MESKTSKIDSRLSLNSYMILFWHRFSISGLFFLNERMKNVEYVYLICLWFWKQYLLENLLKSVFIFIMTFYITDE